MTLHELYYLKDILSATLITKILNTKKETSENIVYMLKFSNITKILPKEKIENLCECIAFGKYGLEFSKSLCDINDRAIINVLVDEYINFGYDNEESYLEIMTTISKVVPDLKMFFVKQEIAAANKKEITVLDFLNSGGSLEEVLTALPYNTEIIENNTLLDYEKAEHLLKIKKAR